MQKRVALARPVTELSVDVGELAADANGLDGEKNLSTVLGPTYGLGDNGEGYQLGNGSTPDTTYQSELQHAKVVTLSAGGNDIYFSDVIATCAAGGIPIALVAGVSLRGYQGESDAR